MSRASKLLALAAACLLLVACQNGGEEAAVPDEEESASTEEMAAQEAAGEEPSEAPAEEALADEEPLEPVGPQLTYEGFDLVVFGDNLVTTARAIGEAPRFGERTSTHCFPVTFSRYPGLSFMVVEGLILRADAEPGVPNALQVQPGDSVEAVVERYPEAAILPHKYDPNGHYLVFTSGPKDHAFVLEESGGAITKVRAGLQPEVEWVEGCL